MKNRLRSFGHAFNGLAVGWNGANFKIQLAIGVCALLGLNFFSIPKLECMVVLICCGAVLGLELINSAIETLADTLHPHKHMGIKKTKDLAASAVLLMSLVSFIVAIMVFLKPVLALF